jgi:hypothetical protein
MFYKIGGFLISHTKTKFTYFHKFILGHHFCKQGFGLQGPALTPKGPDLDQAALMVTCKQYLIFCVYSVGIRAVLWIRNY